MYVEIKIPIMASHKLRYSVRVILDLLNAGLSRNVVMVDQTEVTPRNVKVYRLVTPDGVHIDLVNKPKRLSHVRNA